MKKDFNEYKYFKDLCKKHDINLNIINLILLKYKSKCQKHIKRKIHMLRTIENNYKTQGTPHFIKNHLVYMKRNDLTLVK